jgi:hypothetical protein
MSTSPTEVQKALKGADYPASKDSLIDLARDNQAPDEVVDELEEGLDDEEYESPAEVMADLGGSRESDESGEEDYEE